MKIWLDDERDMPQRFDRHVYTAADAIELLKSGEVTLISLDHDLGDVDAGTGYDVARYIEKAAFDRTLPKLEWELHTSNPVGRRRMSAALTNANEFWKAAETIGELIPE